MKTVLITGASRGIGRAAALLLASRGYSVGVNFLKNKPKALQTVNEILSAGGDACEFCFDVGDFRQVKNGIDAFIARYKKIDALVLNAGVSEFGLLSDSTDDEYERVMQTNLKGVYNCVKAAAPIMTCAGRGSIVAVSSVWGETGASCEAIYSASKAGVIGMVKALAKEYALAGVRVNCVSPGYVSTDMNQRLTEQEKHDFLEQIPMFRAGSPDEIARAIAFLVGDDSSYITGQVLSVNGGLLI
ncbi:MAG: 3-oxoacyl-ACP reductase FabG [Clostridia bacterium]|nr:3-oxoacyl-ACP reductase FabG [Clostridia bacterium]